MEGAPRGITSKGAEGRSADFNYPREAALHAHEDDLAKLDERIAPLLERFRAGEKEVEKELTPLLDQRGKMVRDAAAKRIN